VRISKDQVRENRQLVVDSAAKLFRERGFDGVSVADLMKASGFTHGGFYNHFDSKETLAAEALRLAFRQMSEERSRARNLDELVTNYLAEPHRRMRGEGCPAAGLATDTSRAPEAVKLEFADGLEEMIRSFEHLLPDAIPMRDRRSAAVDLLCRMVGALSLARALPDKDRLAKEILDTARDKAIASST
jgi:TetR/AcrR family transcriptional repressor of nem operon